MEYLKKKRNNNNFNSKSLYSIINKNQKICKDESNIEDYKSLSDEEEEKHINVINNYIDKHMNCNYSINNKLESFYCSNNEKVFYLSNELKSPQVFKSSFDNNRFYCAYNSFKNNRQYNEDKILINCQKNNDTKIHLFSIFDGHGGNKCSKYLMNNFDKILFSNKYLMNKTSKALRQAYYLSENQFKEINKPKNLLIPIEKSGSCALSLLTIGKKIYCANVGDSRALYSEDGSKEVYQISYEHKPQNEIKRIKKAGGNISCSILGNIWRLFPGGIAVRYIYNILFLIIRYQDLLVILVLNWKSMVKIIKL